MNNVQIVSLVNFMNVLNTKEDKTENIEKMCDKIGYEINKKHKYECVDVEFAHSLYELLSKKRRELSEGKEVSSLHYFNYFVKERRKKEYVNKFYEALKLNDDVYNILSLNDMEMKETKRKTYTFDLLQNRHMILNLLKQLGVEEVKGEKYSSVACDYVPHVYNVEDEYNKNLQELLVLVSQNNNDDVFLYHVVQHMDEEFYVYVLLAMETNNEEVLRALFHREVKYWMSFNQDFKNLLSDKTSTHYNKILKYCLMYAGDEYDIVENILKNCNTEDEYKKIYKYNKSYSIIEKLIHKTHSIEFLDQMRVDVDVLFHGSDLFWHGSEMNQSLKKKIDDKREYVDYLLKHSNEEV